MLIGIYRLILCKYFIFPTKVVAYDRKFNYTSFTVICTYCSIYRFSCDQDKLNCVETK